MSSRLKRTRPRHSDRPGWLVLATLLMLARASVMPAGTVEEAQDPAAPAVAPHELPAPQTPHKQRVSRLDERVQALSKALDLDAGQQAELRKLLERQLEQVNRVWNDPAIPAAYRVSATRAINNKTADDIRAMLNEEQKKKYNPPRPPHQEPDPADRTVEDWMSATRSK